MRKTGALGDWNNQPNRLSEVRVSLTRHFRGGWQAMSETQGQENLTTDSRPYFRQARSANHAVFALYALALIAVSHHLYSTPMYDMDSIQYMGNALLMESTDIVQIHHRVYAELERQVPQREREALMGHEPGAPDDQNRSRQQRAESPIYFAEFLPMFAIRPLYNQTLYIVSRSGMGLVRSGIFISVASYFAIGLLLFVWVRGVGRVLSLAVPLLLMMSPPMLWLGRDPTSDALATLVAFASLYLIFQKELLAPGLILLLASIYFRTDFVVLAGPVLLACWLERRIRFWQAGVLALLALSSVLCIQHFGGDYGIKMLYFRNFVGTPSAPAEIAVQFTARDYLSAFRSGITKIAESFFFPFLLLGTVTLASSRLKSLFWIALAYASLHFLALPNWQERWFALFYLCMACTAAASRRGGLRRLPDSRTSIEPHSDGSASDRPALAR